MEPGSLTPEVARWFERRTLAASDPDPKRLTAAKGSRTVGVALPARNEAATVGRICSEIRGRLFDDVSLVDRLVVVDSFSDDDTARVARTAGAEVVAAAEPGKGAALHRSLQVLDTDIVAWIDADIENFGVHFITRLIAPLIGGDELSFVKAFYERPLRLTDETLGPGGARVTEIGARPLLGLLHPQLAGFIQPLAGECAARRSALERISLFTGYAVDVGLLIDMVGLVGIDAIAQVDLGTRVHRNQDVRALGRMSHEVMQAILRRAEDQGRVKLQDEPSDVLVQFDRGTGPIPAVAATKVELSELPPVGAWRG